MHSSWDFWHVYVVLPCLQKSHYSNTMLYVKTTLMIGPLQMYPKCGFRVLLNLSFWPPAMHKVTFSRSHGTLNYSCRTTLFSHIYTIKHRSFSGINWLTCMGWATRPWGVWIIWYTVLPLTTWPWPMDGMPLPDVILLLLGNIPPLLGTDDAPILPVRVMPPVGEGKSPQSKSTFKPDSVRNRFSLWSLPFRQEM